MQFLSAELTGKENRTRHQAKPSTTTITGTSTDSNPEFRNWQKVAGRARGADIVVCQLGRLSSRREAGLESPANRQAGKLCPTLFAAESQAFRFGIRCNCSSLPSGKMLEQRSGRSPLRPR
jgi:hypothetical protein